MYVGAVVYFEACIISKNMEIDAPVITSWIDFLVKTFTSRMCHVGTQLICDVDA